MGKIHFECILSPLKEKIWQELTVEESLSIQYVFLLVFSLLTALSPYTVKDFYFFLPNLWKVV